jgi:hypothetical protein
MRAVSFRAHQTSRIAWCAADMAERLSAAWGTSVHDTEDTLARNSDQLLKLMGRRNAMDLPW